MNTIEQLEAERIAELSRQRDDLRASLQLMLDGFVAGYFIDTRITGMNPLAIRDLTLLIARAQAAIARAQT